MWRGGVDRVAQAAEMPALGFELLDDVEEMADRPGDAIEPDHDEGLLLADRVTAGGALLVELGIGTLFLG